MKLFSKRKEQNLKQNEGVVYKTNKQTNKGNWNAVILSKVMIYDVTLPSCELSTEKKHKMNCSAIFNPNYKDYLVSQKSLGEHLCFHTQHDLIRL